MISKYFTLNELIRSDFADRKGIDNTPSPEIVQNLTEAAMQLDRVRELLQLPVHVNSGYRGVKLNTAIGGSKVSSHMQGWAFDIICPRFGTPREVFEAIKKSGISFDQLILEFPNSKTGGWVHIGFASGMRRETLSYDGIRYSIA